MNTLENSFKELIQDWDLNPRGFINKEFREKYKSYKSNYKAGLNNIGPKIKLEMLRKAGYELIMVKKSPPDKEPGQNSPTRSIQEP